MDRVIGTPGSGEGATFLVYERPFVTDEPRDDSGRPLGRSLALRGEFCSSQSEMFPRTAMVVEVALFDADLARRAVDAATWFPPEPKEERVRFDSQCRLDPVHPIRVYASDVSGPSSNA